MNGYLRWIRISAILQIVTGCFHAMAFIKERAPQNETERTLNELMSTYRPDMGPLFHPTMQDLVNSLSACFSLLYLFAGIISLYLLPRGLSANVWKGLVSINLMIFGAAFLVMLLLTFLPPIVMTGLVFISLCLAYATNHIHRLRLPQN